MLKKNLLKILAVGTFPIFLAFVAFLDFYLKMKKLFEVWSDFVATGGKSFLSPIVEDKS